MPEQTLADEIRHFVNEQYFEPARKRGEKEKIVPTGDVHSGMSLGQKMTVVCDALSTKKFEKQYNVRLIGMKGSIQISKPYFMFHLRP